MTKLERALEEYLEGMNDQALRKKAEEVFTAGWKACLDHYFIDDEDDTCCNCGEQTTSNWCTNPDCPNSRIFE